MNSKARQLGAARPAPRGSNAVELQIGRDVVDIWFDDNGIHFRGHGDRHTEGVLPWDIAMAMSVVPEQLRRTPRTPLA